MNVPDQVPIMRLHHQMPVLRPLRNEEELKRLVKAAADDGHLVWGATFLVEKAGELVGYVGLDSVPTYQGWLHTQKIGPFESASVISQVENHVRMRNGRNLLLLLPETSPFCPVIHRFNYRHLANAQLHIKTL